MQRTERCFVLAALCLLTIADVGGAQLRRSAGDGGGAPANLPTIAANPRFPFAGSWVGRRQIEENGGPFALAIQVTDTKYSSVMILPDNAQVPMARTRLVGDALVFESPNSGGGMWVYQMKRLAGDSLVGTVQLRDAPAGFGPKPPSGTVTLIRYQGGSGGR